MATEVLGPSTKGRVECSTKFSKRWDFTGSQFLKGVGGLKRVTFFRGRVQFLLKNKLNLKYLMAKTEVFLFVITKNFNWKVLTKNLITFKR